MKNFKSYEYNKTFDQRYQSRLKKIARMVKMVHAGTLEKDFFWHVTDPKNREEFDNLSI